MQYLRELIERYAREPGEGLISRLVHDDGPDGPMSPEEAVPNTSLLLIAGHDSTVNTIAHCVLTRAAQPRVARAAAQPPGTDPRAPSRRCCDCSRRFSSFPPAAPPAT